MSNPFGTPLDPAKAPSRPEQAPPPAPSPGQPIEAPPPRGQDLPPQTVMLGLDLRQPPPNLPAGMAPRIVNWRVTPEGLTPRLGYSAVVTASTYSNAGPAPAHIATAYSVLGEYTPVVFSETSQPMRYVDGTWSALTFAGAGAAMPGDFIGVDSAIFYDPVADENALAFTQGTESWYYPARGSASYSALTNAPSGIAIAYHNTRLVFANIADTSSGISIPQRIVWSERGDPRIYAEPTGGTEDIVSMRGGITKLMDDSERLIVIGEHEIWQGYPADFPFDYQFARLDGTVGSPHPRTVQRTPVGIIFLADDNNVYLLPKGGNQAQPIGFQVKPFIDRNIDTYVENALPGNPLQPTNSASHNFAVYDPRLDEYQLFVQTADYVAATPGAYNALTYNIYAQAWSHYSFNRAKPFSAGALVPQEFTARNLSVQTALPVVYLASATTVSRSSVFAVRDAVLDPVTDKFTSADTQDDGSAFSAYALFPIGNSNPAQQIFLRELRIDYSNFSTPSGSSLTVACSSDFGQTYDTQIGVALPFTQYSRQTVVPLGYSAVYPSVELRYESQVSGNFLKIQRLTATIEPGGRSA